MNGEAWHNLGRRFLARVVMPIGVAILLMFFLMVLKMLAGTPAAPAKPRDPALERRHDPPAQPRLGHDLTSRT
jgi:hypothetical protein